MHSLFSSGYFQIKNGSSFFMCVCIGPPTSGACWPQELIRAILDDAWDSSRRAVARFKKRPRKVSPLKICAQSILARSRVKLHRVDRAGQHCQHVCLKRKKRLEENQNSLPSKTWSLHPKGLLRPGGRVIGGGGHNLQPYRYITLISQVTFLQFSHCTLHSFSWKITMSLTSCMQQFQHLIRINKHGYASAQTILKQTTHTQS